MKILLISMLKKSLINFGLRYINSTLINSGHDSEIVFLPNEIGKREIDKIKQFFKEKSPDIVGMSLMSCNFPLAQELTSELKLVLPEAFFIWGGTHPTIFPEKCIPLTDAICVGEGEMPLLEIADRMKEGADLRDVLNIWFNNKGVITRNPTRPFINPLDSIPLPDWAPDRNYVMEDGELHVITREKYRQYMPYNGTVYNIAITRGCPNLCTYCSNSVLRHVAEGQYVRKRSPENVLEELRRAKKDFPFIKYINFQDDCITSTGGKWLGEFSPAYKKEIGLQFLARLIPKRVTPEKVAMLFDMGMGFVTMGLQCGSKRITVELFNRNTLPEDFIRAARILDKYPILKNVDVLIHNPYETEEDIMDTLTILCRLKKPFNLQVFHLTAFPGTPFYDRAVEDGQVDKLRDPYNDSLELGRGSLTTEPARAHLYNLVCMSNYLPSRLLLFLAGFRSPTALRISKTLMLFTTSANRLLKGPLKKNLAVFFKLLNFLRTFRKRNT